MGNAEVQTELVDAVLSVLHRMVWADGEADPRELEVGADVARRMLGEWVTEAAVARVLGSPHPPPSEPGALQDDARLIVLRAAAAVAGADQRIDASEVAVLRAIGAELALNPAVVDSVIAGLQADTRARGELAGLRAVAVQMLGVTLETPVVEVHARYRELMVAAEDVETAEQLTWAFHTALG